jgi:hypothetical protein
VKGIRAIVGYLGWWSFALLILAVVGLFSWWRWDRGRQLPLPPQAQNVSVEIIGSLSKRTTFAVPASVDDVRAFYRDVLPQRGWSYCGTQATPRCTNLANAVASGGTGDQSDIYRRVDDQDFTGTTIEVWPAAIPSGGTRVSVYETNPPR